MENTSIPEFVIAVRVKARNDETFGPTSEKSRVKLLCMLTDKETGLRNPKNRIPFLQAITGLPLTSQKQLTQWMTSTLIDEVLHAVEKRSSLLRDIEDLLESDAGRFPWRLFPWEGPGTDMSVLSEGDSRGTADARGPDLP